MAKKWQKTIKKDDGSHGIKLEYHEFSERSNRVPEYRITCLDCDAKLMITSLDDISNGRITDSHIEIGGVLASRETWLEVLGPILSIDIPTQKKKRKKLRIPFWFFEKIFEVGIILTLSVIFILLGFMGTWWVF